MNRRRIATYLAVFLAGVGGGFLVGRWTAPEEQLDSEGLARVLAPLANIPVVAEVRATPLELPAEGGDVELSVRIEAGTAPREVTFRLEGPGGRREEKRLTEFKPTGREQWVTTARLSIAPKDPAGSYHIVEVVARNEKDEEGLVFDEPGKPAVVIRKR